MLRDFLNTEELSRYLEVDLNSIQDWADSGKIPALKEGNSWKFERKAVDTWIASGKVSR
jgi:excisionase family DNA binding protein